MFTGIFSILVALRITLLISFTAILTKFLIYPVTFIATFSQLIFEESSERRLTDCGWQIQLYGNRSSISNFAVSILPMLHVHTY